MKLNVKQLKETTTGTALPVMGGLMVANAVDKLVPVSNEKIKSAIPIGGGLILMAVGGNDMLKNAGAGMLAFGTIKLIRSVVAPKNTFEGIAGISDNPMVRKVVDYLLPNLGSDEEYPIIYHNPNSQFENNYSLEPITMDIPYAEELNGIENPYREDLGSSNPFM